jgi:acid phosphatase family membrane protein YuiD
VLKDSPYIWIAPLTAMVIAQLLKPIWIMVRIGRWDWQRMRQSGGMPSSHTALVVALVAELALRRGGQDPVLALAVFVALVVMYDAAGVRWQTGRHAAMLNRLSRDLRRIAETKERAANPRPLADPRAVGADDGASRAFTSSPKERPFRPLPVASAPWWLIDWPVLDEHVGHKPIEVLGGCIVGLLVALWLH